MPQDLTELSDNDIIGTVAVLKKLSEEMQDSDLDAAMVLVIKCIRKPDVPPEKAVDAIVKLQAISAKLALGSVLFKTYGKNGTLNLSKEESRYRKDVYYTAKEAINLLVDALKYIIRAHERGSGSRH